MDITGLGDEDEEEEDQLALSATEKKLNKLKGIGAQRKSMSKRETVLSVPIPGENDVQIMDKSALRHEAPFRPGEGDGDEYGSLLFLGVERIMPAEVLFHPDIAGIDSAVRQRLLTVWSFLFCNLLLPSHKGIE